ncbi:MAG: hypothetical protein PF501_04550 [Salinisphaera sp.]|jgi:hypothetical protein|nr:hypothetical protein [Salinisphaera sp.]
MSTSDVSGKRSVSPAQAFAANHANQPFKKRKTPMSLDSRTFAHHVKMVADESDPTIIAAKNAFNSYASALDQLYDREVTIRADATKTTAAHDLRVSQIAAQALEPVGKRAQAATDQLNNQIAQIDTQIEHDTKARMTPAEQQEIRSFVKGLSDEQRRSFLSQADDDTLSAVMSGKSYLSGMRPAEAQVIEHNWRQRKFPDLINKRARYERARDLITTGFEQYMSNVHAMRDPGASEMQQRMDAADAAVKSALNFGDDS